MTDTYLSAPVRPQPRTAARPEPPVFRRDVQGLRGLAILLLVAAHVGLAGRGELGIDLFLVVSGFLITTWALREMRQHGRLALTRFYARRTTRLVPASVLVVLGTLGAAWHWMPAAARPAVAGDALAAATGTMNLRLALQDGVPAVLSPLQHFWPLSLLVQFTLLWPLLLTAAALAWARRGRPHGPVTTVVVAGLTAASLALWLVPATLGPAWTSFGLPGRFWEFGAGALVALGARQLAELPDAAAAATTWLGLGLIGTAVAVSGVPPVPVAVVGAVLLVAGGCAHPSWGARRLLRVKPLQELGRVAFSWYLWHWPVLVLAPYVLGRPLPVPVRLALAVAALVPAAMSVAAVENRIHRHRGLRVRPGRALALGAALVVVTVGLAGGALRLPVPAVRDVRAEPRVADLWDAGAVDLAQVQELVKAGSAATTLPRELTPPPARAGADVPRDGGCLAPVASRSVTAAVDRGCERHGVAGSGRVVVLFGDSHAQQWFPALEAVAVRRGWRLAVFTKQDCGAASGQVGRFGGVTPYSECDQWRSRVLDRIDRLRPALVVMSQQHHPASPLEVRETAGPDQDWASAWVRTVSRVKLAGALPVVIPDTPIAHRDVPRCLTAYPAAIDRCALPVVSSLSLPRQRVVRAVVQTHGARVVDTTAWFCTPLVCPAVVGDTVVYRDDNHLTSAYVQRLTGLLDQALAG